MHRYETYTDGQIDIALFLIICDKLSSCITQHLPIIADGHSDSEGGVDEEGDNNTHGGQS